MGNTGSLSSTPGAFLDFRPNLLELLSWKELLRELNKPAVYDQISDHSDISQFQTRFCFGRPISVYRPFPVLPRSLVTPRNIIPCWFSRASRKIFFVPLRSTKIFLRRLLGLLWNFSFPYFLRFY